MYGGAIMRTTLILPDNLMSEAMQLTKIKTKTALVIEALKNLINKEKIKDLKNYYGKIDLDINLDDLRQR